MTSRRWQRLVSLALVTVLVGAVGDVPIVDAAKNSDRDALRTLLEQGADVNARAGDGATALLWASYRDDMDSAELLIGAGADVDLANDLGATPLWAASRNGSPAMAGLLLEAGADPDAPLLLGETPLITAARTGNPQVVRMLLEAGAEVNARGARGQTPLMFAAAQRHPDAVKLLLEYGADVTLRTHVWNQLRAQSPHAHPEHQLWVLHGGNDALMFAARVGDAESAKHLITAGADVNAKSAWGLTPLVMAAYADFGDQWLIREQTTNNLIYFDRDQILPGQFGELVEFLLEQGADPNVGAERYSPLIMAVLRKNEEAVELLLGHGADPNAPLGDFTPIQRGSTTDYSMHRAWLGASPLWLAAGFGTLGVVRLLLEHGADPTFVHEGVYYGGRPGGNLSQRIEETTTTLMAAVKMVTGGAWSVVEPDEEAVLETVTLLVEAGVDVNAVDSTGRTAAEGARGPGEAALAQARARGRRLRPGYPSVVEFLVRSGAKSPGATGF